ncbi:UDP-N-acetylmuramoyl-L-alanine--D-glutamate ligase [Arachidicoccus ginsenosidimutans]|uniref:UDP-N-acetylmuramoyl-L-alanine--D-glutamate ligase n=1 Tax=Arachidicoccus sp. BS20 TaxID=1850526 RepID=UPI0009ED9FC5|nr:UDP-N-acetylmuramoyl-L-alanine--D-glutamate ligase [Arachidicoccus sp. BS20]
MNNEVKNINQQQNFPSQGTGVFVVLGAGESGVGAALLWKQHGYNVFVSDAGKIADKYKKELQENGIEFEEGHHSEEKILSATEVMKSPGIPDKVELIKKIRAKNIPVISEIELAYRYKGDSKIVATTGTNGKSTTTSLIYHICKTAGLDCALVGNIGYSFAKQIAEAPKALYVAEISSFQLDDIKTFRPDIAILLNITEDHLDRYNYDIENYIKSKFRIIENQTAADYFIYNLDDELITAHLKSISFHSTPLPFSMKQEVTKGAYIKDNQMMIKAQEERVTMNIYDFVALKGKHNQYNTMAAGIAASVLDIRKEKIREAVQTFESLEHRMEFVATIRGVDFINDSKGTNLNSVWFALESMTKPTVLILGGVDKGNDYSMIEELVKEKVKAIVCLGLDNEKIINAFKDTVPITETTSMKDAVQAAYSLADKGDVVLLSPGCSSFDLFKNYMERGEQFKEQVKEL